MIVNAFQRKTAFFVRLVLMALVITASVSLLGQTLAPGTGRNNRSTKAASETAAPSGTVTQSTQTPQTLQLSPPPVGAAAGALVKTPAGALSAFQITPAPDFYVATVGSSDPETITVANLSQDSYTLNNFVSSNADFSVAAGLTAVVPAGGSYQIPVTYKPATLGVKAATLNFSVTKAGAGAALTATVNLHATDAPLTFESSDVFAALPGQTSLTQKITLVNHTGDTYQIKSMGIQGGLSSGFLTSGLSTAVPLAAKGTLDIPVAYRPRKKQKTLVTIVIHASKAGAADEVVSTTLTGVGDVGVLTQNPSARTQIEPFTLAPQQTSAYQILKIEWKDKGAYTYTGYELSGANPDDYSVSDCDPNWIDLGKNCSIIVTYKPAATAQGTSSTSSATLQLTVRPAGGGADIPFKMDLSGGGPAKTVCNEPQARVRHTWLPLIGPGANSDTVNCWYNSSNFYALLGQVHYTYNPGGSANTVNSDLASLNFIGGVQLTLSGAASTSSCDSSSTGTNTSCNSSSSATTAAGSLRRRDTTATTNSTASTTPSLQQDVQNLIKGGDFGLRVSWPVYQVQGHGFQLYSVILPKAGFTVNGLSTQNTATNATEVNENISSETYVQMDALAPTDGGESPGSIFIDYRGGRQFVDQSFATAAGLSSSHFWLQQLSLGVVFNGAIRLSAQRYWGPEQAYVDSSGNAAKVNNWNNWQLGVQITPTNVAK